MNDLNLFGRWQLHLRLRLQARQIKTFCLFIGYPRSGHSIFGALLDAHPEAIVSHQIQAFRLLKYSLHKIYFLICQKSIEQAAAGRLQNIYSYHVPGQFQGRFTKLNLIGDKGGDRLIREIQKQPDVLDQIQNKVQIPVHLVHVIRNPFDSISTSMIRKHEKKNLPLNDKSLGIRIDQFFSNAETVMRIKLEEKYPVIDIHHEDFIHHPGQTLQGLCDFLKLPASEKYLNDCVSIVKKTVNYSRFNLPDLWTEERIDQVESKMKEFSFFNPYSFSRQSS
jgi:hypothetical protein